MDVWTPGKTYHVGDAVTIEGPFLEPWWVRILVRLGLRRSKPRRIMTGYIVATYTPEPEDAP